MLVNVHTKHASAPPPASLCSGVLTTEANAFSEDCGDALLTRELPTEERGSGAA